jgi:hypothetical protein
MKAYINTKLLLLGVVSTLLLNCNLTKAAAFFDPLASHAPKAGDKPLADLPCVWPDPDEPLPGGDICNRNKS